MEIVQKPSHSEHEGTLNVQANADQMYQDVRNVAENCFISHVARHLSQQYQRWEAIFSLSYQNVGLFSF
jgi:hypothetical protein